MAYHNIQIGDPDTETIYITSTARASAKCKHTTGWFATIKFWMFWKEIFVCSDCGECLAGKKLKTFFIYRFLNNEKHI